MADGGSSGHDLGADGHRAPAGHDGLPARRGASPATHGDRSSGKHEPLPIRPDLPAAGPPRARVGLLVNPIAGLGGRVGLKGSDGPDTVERALALGARPEAGHRAGAALAALLAAWPRHRPAPTVLVAPGPMGEDAAREAGTPCKVVPEALPARTTAADTLRFATRLHDAGVELLLFAGGDGTARDIHAALGDEFPALGIPAGVKVQSAVFGTSPAATGRAAAVWFAASRRRTVEREVLDLDEDAYRRGEVRPRLHGYLRVPSGPLVQSRKAPSPPEEGVALGGIAAAVCEAMDPAVRWILGPGTTVRAVAERLGIPKTLVGIDVVAWQGDAPLLLAADVGERQLLELVSGHAARIVVTPIGGQGFLFGRGNQPISPAVIRAVGRDCIVVVAGQAKLAALQGRPLLVDTGDPALDRALAGHISVISGYRDRAVVAVVPA